MPSGPKKRRAARKKKDTLEVVLQEPEDHVEVKPLLDSYIAEEIKQENLGNLNSGNQEGDLGSVISKKQETLPGLTEFSVGNEKPSKQETAILSESALMAAADHEKPDEVSAADELFASPITDESDQMNTDGSDPITGTDLNALSPKRCKTEAKEVLLKTAISSDELELRNQQLLTIKARNDNLKVCLEAALQLSDELTDAVMELLK